MSLYISFSFVPPIITRVNLLVGEKKEGEYEEYLKLLCYVRERESYHCRRISAEGDGKFSKVDLSHRMTFPLCKIVETHLKKCFNA